MSVGINIMRVGLGITFLWVGVLIFREPETWGKLLQPWTLGILAVPLKTAMIQTAIMDFLIGFFLLVDRFTFLFLLLALAHLILVIIVVGITAGTVSDIGLAAGALALVFAFWPKRKAPFVAPLVDTTVPR